MNLVGRPAPAFTLFDTKRQPVSLASYRGKQVVLAFYPAAFTSVCTAELCTFRDTLASFDELNAVVFGISVDAPQSNKAFADQLGLSFELLSDYSRAAVEAYGVAWPNFAGLPGYVAANRAVFVVGADGVVTWQWVGEHPGQAPPFDDVHAALRA